MDSVKPLRGINRVAQGLILFHCTSASTVRRPLILAILVIA